MIQAVAAEVVVLLGAGDWRQDVERRHVRGEEAKRPEMLEESLPRVRGEAEDVGEVAGDPVLAAERDDPPYFSGGSGTCARP